MCRDPQTYQLGAGSDLEEQLEQQCANHLNALMEHGMLSFSPDFTVRPEPIGHCMAKYV